MPVTRQHDGSEDEDYRRGGDGGEDLFLSSKQRYGNRGSLNNTVNDSPRTARLSAIKANNAIGIMSAKRQQPLHDNINIQMETENDMYGGSEEEDIDDDDDDEDDDDVIEGFRMKAKLPEPKMAKRNIAQLMGKNCPSQHISKIVDQRHSVLLDGEFLDVNPAYQRDVVWPSKSNSKIFHLTRFPTRDVVNRMSKLVDSLMGRSSNLINHYIDQLIQ